MLRVNNQLPIDVGVILDMSDKQKNWSLFTKFNIPLFYLERGEGAAESMMD